MGDWRVGLTVKPKYRNDDLYYETGEIIEVLPSGTGGFWDEDGVLKIKLCSGIVVLRPADQWIVAR